jgi:hypothetical protein
MRPLFRRVFYIVLTQDGGTESCHTCVHSESENPGITAFGVEFAPRQFRCLRATGCVYVRIHGLENRQGFTAFVSSNLTLSAKTRILTGHFRSSSLNQVLCYTWCCTGNADARIVCAYA